MFEPQFYREVSVTDTLGKSRVRLLDYDDHHQRQTKRRKSKICQDRSELS